MWSWSGSAISRSCPNRYGAGVPRPDDRVTLDPLSEDDVQSIVAWRYGGDYTMYDHKPGDRATLVDPGNEFLAIRRDAQLIGYVCLGVEARVAGMSDDPAVIDLGVGVRPDLTGHGHSRWLMPATLSALEARLGRVTFRAVIKDWNRRAQRAAEHAGFEATGTHRNDAGAWVLMTRQRRPGRGESVRQ